MVAVVGAPSLSRAAWRSAGVAAEGRRHCGRVARGRALRLGRRSVAGRHALRLGGAGHEGRGGRRQKP